MLGDWVGSDSHNEEGKNGEFEELHSTSCFSQTEDSEYFSCSVARLLYLSKATSFGSIRAPALRYDSLVTSPLWYMLEFQAIIRKLPNRHMHSQVSLGLIGLFSFRVLGVVDKFHLLDMEHN